MSLQCFTRSMTYSGISPKMAPESPTTTAHRESPTALRAPPPIIDTTNSRSVRNSLASLGLSRYSINDNGVVRNNSTTRLLNGTTSSDGYVTVTLVPDLGKPKSHYVHRLVAQAFIPNPHNFPTVDHIDRNRSNNVSTNLRWANRSMQSINQNHANGRGRTIIQLSPLTSRVIKKWPKGRQAAQAFDFDFRLLPRACKRKFRLGGYRWRYATSGDDHTEVWKKVPLDTAVEVFASDAGRIKDTLNGRERIRQVAKRRDNGYVEVGLCMANGRRKSLRVHRLVAMAFLGLPGEDQTMVNHRDGNRSNNCVANLEWISNRDNVQHAIDTGLRKTKPVNQFTMAGEFVRQFVSVAVAAKTFGRTTGGLYMFLRGHGSSCWGFCWDYAMVS